MSERAVDVGERVLGSCPPTRWLPTGGCGAHRPSGGSRRWRAAARSDSPDSVGDDSALSVVSSRVCWASVTFGIADSASSMGARSSARSVTAVTGWPLAALSCDLQRLGGDTRVDRIEQRRNGIHIGTRRHVDQRDDLLDQQLRTCAVQHPGGRVGRQRAVRQRAGAESPARRSPDSTWIFHVSPVWLALPVVV